MDKKIRRPECHPEKKHRARGLCNRCYNREFYHRFPEQAVKARNRAKAYAVNNPEKVKAANRNKHLIKKFGITLDEYHVIAKKQKNICKICGKKETVKSRKINVNYLAVDHDHKTGKIRGLLCFKCNTTIAHIEGNKGIIEAISRYIS